MAWVDQVAGLNDTLLAEFGETVTYAQATTESQIAVIWFETDGGASPIRLQTKRSSFGAFPKQNERVMRNGINYAIKAPKQLDGDWIELELRQISQ